MNQIRPVDSVAQLAVSVKLLLQMVPCVWSSVIVTELSVEMESAEFKVVRIQTASRFTKPKHLRVQQIPRSALQVSRSSILCTA